MILKIVSAIGGDVIEMNAPSNTTIAGIKREVSRRKRIPEDIFVLAFRGTEIRNENLSLDQIGVSDYDKLYLITRTEGGTVDQGKEICYRCHFIDIDADTPPCKTCAIINPHPRCKSHFVQKK